MIEDDGGRDVPGRRREPLPRGHLPERRQGDPLLPGLRLGGHDREHRPPGQEAGHQAGDRRRGRRHPHRRTSSSPSARSTRRTRTSPTRPTPTTGPGSRARRASASSTSAPCSARTERSGGAAPSSGWVPASTSSRPRSAARRTGGTGRAGRVGSWPSPRSAGSRPSTASTPSGGDGNPISSSSVLVNAYVADADRRIGWDFEDETPGNDARGFAREGSMPPRSRPTWSTRCSPTGPATTWTTPTPSTRPPSASTP